jgi:lipooligosaccharide transport system permease protein
VQPVTWLSPLWHGTELARGVSLGGGPSGGGAALPALGHAAVLVALVVAGSAVAAMRFRQRLYR